MQSLKRVTLGLAILIFGGGLSVAGGATANASTAPVATAATQVMACKSGHGEGELWSPAGRNIGATKTWKCDGHGGYNGNFQWVKADDNVWAEMLVNWESGRTEHKKMTFGKKYTYKGAYSVYIRACDSTGCGGWW
jgi:hypothetical protein